MDTNALCALPFFLFSIQVLSAETVETVIKNDSTTIFQIAPTVQQPVPVPPNPVNQISQTVPTPTDNARLSINQFQPGQVITGKVIGVLSGDIFRMRISTNFDVKVRLAGIAAPVKHQVYSEDSKSNLFRRIIDKDVAIQRLNTSMKGVVFVVQAYSNGKWINRDIVAEGWGWYFPQTYKSDELAGAQQLAISKKLGIWADKNPIPPWKYRKPAQVNTADGKENPQPLPKIK